MKRIYKEQTSLRITVKTGVLISESDVPEIKYKKPDGVLGSFSASIKDSETGTIYYDIQAATEIDISGWWMFWAFVTFSDGRYAMGKAVKVFVSEQGY
jgi:hypothetical protein